MALVIRKRVMDRIRLGGYRTAKIKEPFRRDGRARVRHMPRADARQPFRPPSVRWDRGIRPAMMKRGLGMATSYWLGAQKSTTGAACALAVMLAMPTRRPATPTGDLAFAVVALPTVPTRASRDRTQSGDRDPCPPGEPRGACGTIAVARLGVREREGDLGAGRHHVLATNTPLCVRSNTARSAETVDRK